MIKELNPDHISECVQVIKESFLTVAEEFSLTDNNAPRFTAFAATEERISWHLHGEHRPMYAYYENHKIIGYYSLALQDSNECELNNLCVLPAFRHKGIEAKLLTHAFQVAKEQGLTKMNIGIVEENKRLRDWYETFGFVHTGTEKFEFFPFTCGYMVKKL
ncbi:MAG: GNAT family N-acetyltransferase [Ruminococcaceae bacterium]|nr:GNAT family N-acetyltransferase [Oscillospiraceae bacterium]